ncbi:hypothetical protein D3C84_740020 [compost metagenome]
MFFFIGTPYNQCRLPGVAHILSGVVVNDVDQAFIAQLEQLTTAKCGIYSIGYQGCLSASGIEVDDLDIALGQPMRRQKIDRHQMAVGSTKDRHLLAFQILDAFEFGALGNCQVKVGTYTQRGQQSGVQPIGTPDDCGQIALVGEIKLLVR